MEMWLEFLQPSLIKDFWVKFWNLQELQLVNSPLFGLFNTDVYCFFRHCSCPSLQKISIEVSLHFIPSSTLTLALGILSENKCLMSVWMPNASSKESARFWFKNDNPIANGLKSCRSLDFLSWVHVH